MNKNGRLIGVLIDNPSLFKILFTKKEKIIKPISTLVKAGPTAIENGIKTTDQYKNASKNPSILLFFIG